MEKDFIELSTAFGELSVQPTKSSDLVRIKVGDQSVKCTRDVLVRNSKYFQALFDFQKDRTTTDVDLKGGIEFEAVQTIIDGLESGRISIDENNVQTVLLGSIFLQCSIAEKACVRFMLNRLTFGNCFSVFILALNCGSTELSNATEDFILNKVQSFSFRLDSVMDLLHWDVDTLKAEVENINDNRIAHTIVCGWLIYDFESRRSHIGSLLSLITIELLTPPESILTDGLEDEKEILEALDRCQKYEALSMLGKVEYWTERDYPTKWPKLSIVCSAGNTQSMVAYRDVINQKWHQLTTKPSALKIKSMGSVVICIRNVVYFVGGEGNECLWTYSIQSDCWKIVACQEERIRPAVCSADKMIYVFGGFSDHRKLVMHHDATLRFNTVTAKWEQLSPMPSTRSGGQACAVRGKIYLFGGLDDKRKTVIACHAYDIEKDEWSQVTDLPSMTTDFGMAVVRDTIYLIGGIDPLTHLTKKSVLAFNVRTNSWSTLDCLNVARKSCAAFYDESHLYAVGGTTSDLARLSSCERFCPIAMKWQLVGNLPRSLTAAMTAAVGEIPIRLMANYRELTQSKVYFH